MNWKITKYEHRIIHQIAERTVAMASSQQIGYDLQAAEMDITAAHLNGCPLDLEKLATAPEFDFAHDVFGIRRHLDRQTGKLNDFFLPRCAKPISASVS